MLNFLKSNKKYIIFDIGSHKIAGISFKLYNGKPYIIGLDHQKSKGIRNNKLNDIEKLSLIIGKILRNIEKDYKRANFFCNITDPNLTTTKKKTDLNAGKLGISKKEVRKIFRKSLNESEKKGKYLIHSNPNSFVLDDKGLTSNPIGKKCSKFSIISFNLLIDNYYVKKLNSSFFKNNINVKRFFDSGIASSMSCLTSKEKEEGVVCIDIGGETSKIVVFMNGNIIFAENLTLAGNNVTTDISHGLQIPDEAAEVTKIKYGSVIAPFNEKFEINLDSNQKKIIGKNLLYGIIRPRYDEIFEIIRDKIFDNINTRISIRSVVLTGGGSKIFGIKQVCERIFNRKTRISGNIINNNLFGDRPEFSTLLGMINLIKDTKFQSQIASSSNMFSKIIDKFDNWIEESYV